MRWWSVEASPRAAYALAAAIGLASLLVVHGVGFVVGTSHYWDMPALDHRSYVMGYRYFLAEPWHWPLFDTTTLNVPYHQSIAFNDSLPLWALIQKAIATVIPPWRGVSARAFLGLWYALASMLQAGFGVANLRARGHRSRGAAIVTAMVFVAIPAWTFRFLHASLYAHFLLLWSLYLYTIPPTPRVRGVQLAQLAIAALINPYHTVMSLAVFAASLARSRRWGAATAWFAAGCVVVVAALALAGYFAPEAGAALTGFNKASTNLLGAFLPRRSGWFGEALWTDPTGLQYEGMCYLGIGLLALLALALSRPRAIAAAVRGNVMLAIVVGGVALLALSNRIYIGPWRVIAYPIPHLLHWIPDQFRSPGRFAWLPMYAVAIFLLSHGFARLGIGWRRFVLPVLAIAQLVDVTPDWRAWRAQTAVPAASQLDVAAWRALLAHTETIDEVDVFPAHACNSDASFEAATHVQYLASEIPTKIDGVYSARATRDCAADTASLLAFHAKPKSLYVFVAPMLGVARRLAAAGLPCAAFAFGEVCHRDVAVTAALGWPATAAPVELAYGAPLAIADPAALEVGWSWVEDGARWTDGAIARLVIHPIGEPPTNPVLELDAGAASCGAVDVDAAINGIAVGVLHVDGEMRTRTLAIAPPGLVGGPVVELELRPHTRCTKGQRELGIRVQRLSIR